MWGLWGVVVLVVEAVALALPVGGGAWGFWGIVVLCL